MSVQELFVQPVSEFPFTVQFTPNDTAPALFYFTASAWTEQANSLIGVTVALDGAEVGQLTVWANESYTHKALVSMVFPVQFSDLGPHTLTFSAATPTTICDVNDVIGASLIEISELTPFIWNTPGPIPSYTTFTSPESGTALLYMSGSAYIDDGGGVGIYVVIDGNPVALSQYFASDSDSHQAFPPLFVPIRLSYGQHQIGFSTNSGDVRSDENDVYQLAVIY